MSRNFKVAIFLIVSLTWLIHAIWLQNKVLDLDAKVETKQKIEAKSMDFTHEWIRSIKRSIPENTIIEIQQMELQIKELIKQVDALKK